MIELSCDICGGKLIGKPNGVFECENCGVSYSAEWLKEKYRNMSGNTESKCDDNFDDSSSLGGLLKRGYNELKDENWEKAEKIFDEALCCNPESGEVWLGQLLANNHIHDKDEFQKKLNEDFFGKFLTDTDYRHAKEYADDQLLSQIMNWEKNRQRNIEAWTNHKVETVTGSINDLRQFAKGHSSKVSPLEETVKAVSSDKTENKDSLMQKKSTEKPLMFGKYPQSADGKWDIVQWHVLDIVNDKALIISKNALDAKPYNFKDDDVTWENCSLRKWLNSDFINEAFSKEEQSLINETLITTQKNPVYSTHAGNSTVDKIFLLSIEEAEKYFSSNSDRQCMPTEYAKSHGAYVNRNTGNCWCWLRSPGRYQNDAALVVGGGAVYSRGSTVDYIDGCVRPALWITLE